MKNIITAILMTIMVLISCRENRQTELMKRFTNGDQGVECICLENGAGTASSCRCWEKE